MRSAAVAKAEDIRHSPEKEKKRLSNEVQNTLRVMVEAENVADLEATTKSKYEMASREGREHTKEEESSTPANQPLSADRI